MRPACGRESQRTQARVSSDPGLLRALSPPRTTSSSPKKAANVLIDQLKDLCEALEVEQAKARFATRGTGEASGT